MGVRGSTGRAIRTQKRRNRERERPTTTTTRSPTFLKVFLTPDMHKSLSNGLDNSTQAKIKCRSDIGSEKVCRTSLNRADTHLLQTKNENKRERDRAACEL
jgi:hypothetical protein